MPSLPIMSAPSAAPAQTPAASPDNPAAQPAESFGSVLARQQANAGESDTGTPDNGQPTATPADSAATAAILDNKLVELQAPAPDAISMLPGDMLAALLPAAANADGAAANEKSGLRKVLADSEKTSLLAASAADEAGVLPGALPGIPPGDILATLAPAPKAPQGTDTPMQSLTAAGVLGTQKESAGNNAVMPSLFRAPDSAMPSTAVGVAKNGTLQVNAFSAALQVSGEEAANATRLNVGTAQVYAQAAQPDAATLTGLTQAGMASVSPSQSVPAQAAITTPVTHDAWGEEFNQKITWLATQNEQSAELHLNPPNLGPLNVVLKVSGDQATAMFTSPHAAVREAVEQALPKLREMMADNGIMLGNAMVSDQSPREHQKWDGNLSGRARGILPADGSTPAGVTVAPVHRHQGMVDTFA